MSKLISSKQCATDPHLVTLLDVSYYNPYQKNDAMDAITEMFDINWKTLKKCNTHSILTADDYENYGEQAEVNDFANAPLKDFDIVIKLNSGEDVRARFVPSQLSRPQARLFCALKRPEYWFDCYLYHTDGNRRPFSGVLFMVKDGELYADLIYYLDRADEQTLETNPLKLKVRATESGNPQMLEILRKLYNAWILTQWLRVSRPSIKRSEKRSRGGKKPQTPPLTPPKPAAPSAHRTEYNDHFEPERLAIVNGKAVKGYTRRTPSWIRREHDRKLPSGETTQIKPALCGEKSPEAIAAYEAYLKQFEQQKKPKPDRPARPNNPEVTYRCHKRKKKPKRC